MCQLLLQTRPVESYQSSESQKAFSAFCQFGVTDQLWRPWNEDVNDPSGWNIQRIVLRSWTEVGATWQFSRQQTDLLVYRFSCGWIVGIPMTQQDILKVFPYAKIQMVSFGVQVECWLKEKRLPRKIIHLNFQPWTVWCSFMLILMTSDDCDNGQECGCSNKSNEAFESRLEPLLTNTRANSWKQFVTTPAVLYWHSRKKRGDEMERVHACA